MLFEQVQRTLSVQRIKPNEHAMRRRRHCDVRVAAGAGRRDAFQRDLFLGGLFLRGLFLHGLLPRDLAV